MFKSTGLRNVKQMFELFDRIIVPILCYGSEIWGTKKIEYVERVQSKFCKYILGINSKTSKNTSQVVPVQSRTRDKTYPEFFTSKSYPVFT